MEKTTQTSLQSRRFIINTRTHSTLLTTGLVAAGVWMAFSADISYPPMRHSSLSSLNRLKTTISVKTDWSVSRTMKGYPTIAEGTYGGEELAMYDGVLIIV